MKNIIRKRNILSIFTIIVAFISIFIISKLNILPFKYYLLLIISIIILIGLGILLINLKGLVKNIIGILILFITIISLSFITYYTKVTDDFIVSNTSNLESEFNYKYYLISKNKYTDLSGLTINYYENILYKDEALDKISKFNFKTKEYEDINLLISDLNLGLIDIVLIDDSTYSIFNSLNQYNFNIIYEFNIKVADEVETKEFTDVVNIYIAGKDFTYVNNDFNMIVSINLKSKKILLTGMPRDYYIKVYGKGGARDTLSYMGAYGVNTSLKSLEELLSINIDYYIEINTKSLVGLVDTLGGITYCSNQSFETTHALVLDTYVDNGKKLYVKEGCSNYNGIETLTIARERLHIKGGDTQRQINCYKIMMAIFEKMKSVNTLSNYQNVLTSVGNLYKTNIPSDSVKDFIKNMLDNNWKIDYYEIDGRDTKGKVHLTNYIDWVMIPNSKTIDEFRVLYEELREL